MHGIITIGREFGSGGRELGELLSELLGVPYYDKFTTEALRDGYASDMPLSTSAGGTSTGSASSGQEQRILQIQDTLMELGRKGPGLFMGRGADVILKEFRPLRLFVYSDMASKLKRCRDRDHTAAELDDRELGRMIMQVDIERARWYRALTGARWGDKTNYDICLNTSGCSIGDIAPSVAELARVWFSGQKVADNKVKIY